MIELSLAAEDMLNSITKSYADSETIYKRMQRKSDKMYYFWSIETLQRAARELHSKGLIAVKDGKAKRI